MNVPEELKKVLDGEGLKGMWVRCFELIKYVVGDVDAEKGTLQNQINQTQQELDELKNSLVTGKVHMDLLTVGDEQLCTESGEPIIAELGIYSNDFENIVKNEVNKLDEAVIARMKDAEYREKEEIEALSQRMDDMHNLEYD